MSGKARDAFDLTKEKSSARPYGRNTFGQCLLLARRLIEAGTRFVEVNWPRLPTPTIIRGTCTPDSRSA